MDFFDLEAHDGTNANPSVEGAERQRMVAIDIDFILISKILCSITSLFNNGDGVCRSQREVDAGRRLRHRKIIIAKAQSPYVPLSSYLERERQTEGGQGKATATSQKQKPKSKADNIMGTSASSANEATLAKERAFIRSLGDQFPLGDSEIRKWCWCHERLLASSPLPSSHTFSSIPPKSLSAITAWSAIYGDYNPSYSHTSNANEDSIKRRVAAASQSLEAITIVEQYIFPAGLCSAIAHCALNLSSKSMHRHSQLISPSNNDLFAMTKSFSSKEEITAFEASYYSISTSVSQHDNNNSTQSQSLKNFLDGISTSCGRRGSRASLTKLFTISQKNLRSEGNSITAGASKIIHTAYCFALAASYLRSVTLQGGETRESTNWNDFVPQKNPSGMQAMINSLINSTVRQREFGDGVGGSLGFDYSAPSKPSTSGDTVTLEEFLEWAETQAPIMGSALPTFLHALFTFFSPAVSGDESNEPPGVTPFWLPHLTFEQPSSTPGSPTSAFFPSPTLSFDLFALSCASLTLASGRWHRLFSSEANGLSCNRLMHTILGYGGPTIILIRSKDASDKGKCCSGVFGAYTCTPWSQESSGFYGNSDCFLFRLGPDPLAIYHPKGGSDGVDAFGKAGIKSSQESETRNFMYFNPEARSKGFDGLSHGIGFGGTSDMPRLYIDEVLDSCRAAPEDLTFANGPLLSGLNDLNSSAMSNFEVDSMEVYGVGTSQVIEAALLARDGQRHDAEKRIRQAMKGAKGQFLEDFQSGLTGNKLFQHREQIQERDGGCDMKEVEK